MYGVLKQLVGELSSFSEKITMLGELEDGTPLIERYDHRRLWECFSGIQRLITQLLDEITAGTRICHAVTLRWYFFSTELPPAIFEGRNRFFLVFSTEADTRGTHSKNVCRSQNWEPGKHYRCSLPGLSPGIKWSISRYRLKNYRDVPIHSIFRSTITMISGRRFKKETTWRFTGIRHRVI